MMLTNLLKWRLMCDIYYELFFWLYDISFILFIFLIILHSFQQYYYYCFLLSIFILYQRRLSELGNSDSHTKSPSIFNELTENILNFIP